MLKYIYFVLVCLFALTIVGIELRESDFRHPNALVVEQQQTQQLFESTCSKCHGLDQINKATHTAAEWKGVMQRMVTYSNGAITAEHSAKIYQYLLKLKSLEE